MPDVVFASVYIWPYHVYNQVCCQWLYVMITIVVWLLCVVAVHHYPTMQEFARKMVGSDELSAEQLKQIREQKEVRNL